jgi:cell division protein FtsW
MPTADLMTREGWMTTTGVDLPAQAQGRIASLRATMDRPLTSYYLLLGASAMLLTIGLLMVLSASSVYAFKMHDGDSYYYVRRQLIWAVAGLVAVWVASRLPSRWLRMLAWPGFILVISLLVLTVIRGIATNGNQNWLGVGPVAIQPSELAKLALVIWAAHVFAAKERLLGDLKHLLIPVAPGILLAAGLVVLGHDLGTALVFFAILLGMLWVVGVPARVFVFGLSVVGVLVLALATTSAERVARITSFTDPFRYYSGDGWQAAHGLYALSSGGLFGEGIGASQQKWERFPGAHTDFIFAVLGEELGLVGTLLVVALFLTIAIAAVRISLRTSDTFTRYAGFGIVVWLIGQMAINVGMVVTLLPVIGVPLPLLSYGGSALLPTMTALGVLIGFARREPEAARALQLRRRTRPAGVAAGRAVPGSR